MRNFFDINGKIYNEEKFALYSDFEAINPLNVKFKAFGCRGVYQCVTSETSLFTDFPFHPQVLLRDFVKIFHPELLPDYQLRYYQPLSND